MIKNIFLFVSIIPIFLAQKIAFIDPTNYLFPNPQNSSFFNEIKSGIDYLKFNKGDLLNIAYPSLLSPNLESSLFLDFNLTIQSMISESINLNLQIKESIQLEGLITVEFKKIHFIIQSIEFDAYNLFIILEDSTLILNDCSFSILNDKVILERFIYALNSKNLILNNFTIIKINNDNIKNFIYGRNLNTTIINSSFVNIKFNNDFSLVLLNRSDKISILNSIFRNITILNSKDKINGFIILNYYFNFFMENCIVTENNIRDNFIIASPLSEFSSINFTISKNKFFNNNFKKLINLEQNIFLNDIKIINNEFEFNEFSENLIAIDSNFKINIFFINNNYINNISPILHYFKYGCSLFFYNNKILNHVNFLFNEEFIYINEILSVYIIKIIVINYGRKENIPFISYSQGSKLKDYYDDIIIKESNELLIKNFIFKNGFNLNQEILGFGFLKYEASMNNKIILDNIEISESQLNNAYLLGLYGNSSLFINNFNVFNNKMNSFMDLSLFKSVIINSNFSYNILELQLINYKIDLIYEYDLKITFNKAEVSMIDISPFDKSKIQYFNSLNCLCNNNSVNLFGSCYHFKATYNGQYQLNNSILSKGYSNYISGAIDIFSANPTFNPTYYYFSNVTFEDNFALFEGGAISFFFHDSIYQTHLINCKFINNKADKGGAIIASLDNRENSIYIINCTFIYNNADGGGAISIFSGSTFMENASFLSNSGNSIEVINYNSLKINNSIFNNSSSSKYGGAISIIDYSEMRLNNVNFSFCSANFGGVLYVDAYSIIKINNSLFEKSKGESGTILFISKCNKNEISYFENVKFLDTNSGKSIFFIDLSDIDFINCEFENFNSPGFYLSESFLFISQIIIKNGYCNISDIHEGCVFYIEGNSTLELIDIKIEKINSLSIGGIIYIYESNLSINSMNLNQIISEKEGAFIYSTFSDIKLLNIDIENIKNDLVYGLESSFHIDNMNFSNYQSILFEISVFNIDSCKSFLLINSFFKFINTISNGGLIYISNENFIKELNYTISNTKFDNIKGLDGGVIYVENCEVKIIDSEFLNNNAMNGGSIFYQCDDYKSILCNLFLINNKFINNSAENHGGALKWLYKIPINLTSNIFSNNKATNYGNNIASFPIHLKVKINNNTNLENFLWLKEIKSGQKMDYLIEVFLIDQANQKVVNIQDAKMYVDIISEIKTINILSKHFGLSTKVQNTNYTSELIDIAGQTSRNINENSSYSFNDITVTSAPSSIVFLSFTSSLIKEFREDLFESNYSKNNYNDSNYNYVYYLPLSMKECVVGEVYDNSSNTCYKCPKGTYSFHIFSSNCENCLDNAECIDGNNLIISQGYWRANSLSHNIYKCTSNLYLCKGGINSTCEEGYEGNLCEICQDINGHKAEKNYFGLCQECENLAISIIISIPVFFGILIVLKLLTNLFIVEKKNKSIIIDCSLIKLLILHYQMLILVPNVNLSFGHTPNEFIGALTRNWFSFDCIFGYTFNFQSSLNNRMISLTIILIVSIFIANLIFFKWKNNFLGLDDIWKNIKNILIKKEVKINTLNTNDNLVKKEIPFKEEKIVRIIIYNSIFFYLVQSSMIDLSFLGMRCIEIEGVAYSRYSLNYECWTGEHFIWIFLLYLPNIAFWMFGLTYLFYYWNKIVKKKNKKNFIIASVGFKKKFFLFGDIFNLTRKSLIIIISTFSSENSETIPFTVFLLTSFLLLMQFYFKPYNYKVLNKIDAFSLYIVFLTYYTLSYYYTGIDEGLAELFYGLLITMNVFFVFFWLIVFFRSPLKKIITIASKKIEKIYPKSKK